MLEEIVLISVFINMLLIIISITRSHKSKELLISINMLTTNVCLIMVIVSILWNKPYIMDIPIIYLLLGFITSLYFCRKLSETSYI